MSRSKVLKSISVPTWIRGTKENPSHEGPSTTATLTKGMQELATIVADQSKDIKLLRSAISKRGADRYAKKRNGWHAHEADIIGDSDKEVFITNSKGEIVVLNGWKLAPSQHTIRKSLTEYRDDLRNEYTDRGEDIPEEKKVKKQYILNEAAKLDYNPETREYFWVRNVNVPKKFQDVIDSKRKKLPGARKIFRIIIWNAIWPNIKEWYKDHLKGLEGKAILGVPRDAFNQSYFELVIKPVAKQMGLKINILMNMYEIKQLLPDNQSRKVFEEKMREKVDEMVHNADEYTEHVRNVVVNRMNILLGLNQPQNVEEEHVELEEQE